MADSRSFDNQRQRAAGEIEDNLNIMATNDPVRREVTRLWSPIDQALRDYSVALQELVDMMRFVEQNLPNR